MQLINADTALVENGHHANLDLDRFRRQVLANGECVVSFLGASQYAEGGGVSACGIAALNCVRVIFSKEQLGLRDAALVTEIMSRDTMEVSAPIVTSISWPILTSPPRIYAGNNVYMCPMAEPISPGGRSDLSDAHLRDVLQTALLQVFETLV